MNQYNYHAYYLCPDGTKSRYFTKLMYAIAHDLFIPTEVVPKRWLYADKINRLNELGWSALMLAASYGAKPGMNDIVRFLLKHGANVNLQDASGWSTLALSAQVSNSMSSVETVRILLENGANPNLKADGSTVLSLSVFLENSSIETIQLLLDHGADINSVNKINSTALMISISHGSIDIAKLLLERGADANLCNIIEDNALTYVIRYEHWSILNEVYRRTSNRQHTKIWNTIFFKHEQKLITEAIINMFDVGMDLCYECDHSNNVMCVLRRPEIRKYIFQREAVKICHRRVMQNIKSTHNSRWYQPGTLRSRLLVLKHDPLKAYTDNPDLRDYFNANDPDLFAIKARDAIKYMD